MPRFHRREPLEVASIAGAGPAHGPQHGLPRVFMADRIFGTLVERHEDIATEGELHVHRGFRSEGVRIAVEVRVEYDALFADLANSGKAENLEPAGIGQDSARPGHEAVQSAEPLDQLVTRAEEEMVGVAEQDFHVQIFGQVPLRESLDGGLRADGHEYGGLDVAVRRVQHPGAGAGDGTLGLNLEGDLRHCLHLKRASVRRREILRRKHAGEHFL
jgi:hypothetical protein